MKQLFLSFGFLIVAYASNAQMTKYQQAMGQTMIKMNEAKNSPQAYHEVSNSFLRIASNEKTEWLPTYYAAYSLIMEAMFMEKDGIDITLDQADKLLSELSSKTANDEILVLQAFSKSTRIGVDPMTRGMKYGTESAKLLTQAKTMNAENPRIYFLEAQAAYYTPEQFGGGKKRASPLFQLAMEKYNNFKPKSEFMPTWGREAAVKMFEETSK